MNNKAKTVNASAASALIGVILILTIFYILFLPPEARGPLLSGENTTTVSSSETNNTEVSEEVGKLDYIDKSEETQSLTGMYLDASAPAEISAQYGPFIISKGLFSKKTKTVTFGIENVNDVQYAAVGFSAAQNKGILIVRLKGNEIYEARTSAYPSPIVLRKELLQPINTLEFEVDGGFFETKQYSIVDARVILEKTQEEKRTAKTTFTLSSEQYEKLDNAKITYYSICDQKTTGKLQVLLNDRVIQDGAIACESPGVINIYKDDVNSGRNELTFRLSKGKLTLESMELEKQMQPVKPYITYFHLDTTQARQKHVLEIEFVDDSVTKKADVIVNGVKFAVNQKSQLYNRTITNYLKEGNNYVQITPLTTLNIVELRVQKS